MSTLTFYTLYFAIFNTLQVALCMQDFNLFWYCGIATFIYMIDLYLFNCTYLLALQLLHAVSELNNIVH